MAFLNRGQGWVVKKLREMLQSHEVNIARTNEVLQAAG